MGRIKLERCLGLECLEPRHALSASPIASDFVIGINHAEICRLDENMTVALGQIDQAEGQLTTSMNQTLSRYLNRIRSRLSASLSIPVPMEPSGTSLGQWSFTRPSTGDTFTLTVEPIGTMQIGEGAIESTLHLYSISLRQSSNSGHDPGMDYDEQDMLVEWSLPNGFHSEPAFPDRDGRDESIPRIGGLAATIVSSVKQQLASEHLGQFVVHATDDQTPIFSGSTPTPQMGKPAQDQELVDEDSQARLAVEQDEATERLLELGDDSYYFLKNLSSDKRGGVQDAESTQAHSHGCRGKQVDALMAEESELRQLEGAVIELAAQHNSPRPAVFSSEPVSISAVPGLFRAFVMASDLVEPIAAPVRTMMVSGKRDELDDEAVMDDSDEELIAYIQDARLLLPAVIAGGAIMWDRDVRSEKRRRWLQRKSRL